MHSQRFFALPLLAATYVFSTATVPYTYADLELPQGFKSMTTRVRQAAEAFLKPALALVPHASSPAAAHTLLLRPPFNRLQTSELGSSGHS